MKSNISLDEVRRCRDLEAFQIIEARGYCDPEVGIHFFVPDYRLNSLIRRKWIPEVFRQALFVCSPDLSIYYNEPSWIWEANALINRRIGEWWQREGLRVVPTVSWATGASYDICFDWIDEGSIVAISTQGIERMDIFQRGLEEMVRRIKPEGIICYSTRLLLEVECPVYYFYTYSQKRFKRLREEFKDGR